MPTVLNSTKGVSRDLKTCEVVSACCRFCKFLGKEGNDDDKGKRKTMSNVKFFTAPWRCDNMKSHLKINHKIMFAKFSKCSIKERRNA
jgi:hypothetical protein